VPISISQNLVAQSPKFTINQKGGQRVVLYLVSGLDPTLDPVTAAASAVDASTGFVMPIYGSAYPFSSGLGLWATLLEFEPFPKESRTSVLARVTYTSPQWSLSPGGVKVRISSATSQTAIDTDSSGDPLKVYYTDPSGTVYDDEVHLLVPQPHTVLEIERIESGSPLATAAQYVGSVNSDSFEGGDANTWMCRSISGESLGSGQYRVSYTFEYDPNTWQEIYAFRDTVTRRTPSDVAPSTGNDHGIYTYTPPQQEFGTLGLPDVY
jgi:hypothetical protein